MTLNIHIFKTPFGNLLLEASEKALLLCQWTDETPLEHHSPSSILEMASLQLNAYFQGKLKQFDLPFLLDGTPFQKKVWSMLQTIPYGETCSYQDIAQNINHPKAVRAVGSANGKNPLCIFIPCHRVIRSNGALGGYSAGLGYKEKLLSLESSLYDKG